MNITGAWNCHRSQSWCTPGRIQWLEWVQYGWRMTLSIILIIISILHHLTIFVAICSLKLEGLTWSNTFEHQRTHGFLPPSPGGMKLAWAMRHGACGWMMVTWKLRCDLPKPPRSAANRFGKTMSLVGGFTILFFFILSYSFLSYFILFFFILSYFILSYSFLSYFILFYSFLSYTILSYS
jgi:hypothetical protein